MVRGWVPAAAMRSVGEPVMERKRSPLNATKTRCVRVLEERLENLGYRVGRDDSTRAGAATSARARAGSAFVACAARSVRCRKRRKGCCPHRRWRTTCTEPCSAGRMTSTWRASPTCVAVDMHALKRFRQWLCRRYEVKAGKSVLFPDERLGAGYGLARLSVRMRSRA